MSEWIWLNGKIMPMEQATIGVEDRGFQFADGVYDVARLYAGKPFTLNEHLDRLDRSCQAILLPPLPERSFFVGEIHKLLAKSAFTDAMLYFQVTRGVAPRNHLFPEHVKPTILFYCRAIEPLAAPGTARGLKLVSIPDERWKRCWIKTLALLPNVLSKNAAHAAGADEGVFIDNGIATECCSSNFFVIKDGKVFAHPVGSKVLPGITRLVISQVAAEIGVPFVEQGLTEKEALAADECFITSTTKELCWVTRWNDRQFGTAAGPVTMRLHHAYQARVKRDLGL